MTRTRSPRDFSLPVVVHDVTILLPLIQYRALFSSLLKATMVFPFSLRFNLLVFQLCHRVKASWVSASFVHEFSLLGLQALNMQWVSASLVHKFSLFGLQALNMQSYDLVTANFATCTGNAS